MVNMRGHKVHPARAQKLSQTELRQRALRLKLILTDCDGVLTDTGVYYSEQGEALKRFSIRDGMGVERLRLAGIETAIISSENSKLLKRRSEKLQLPFLFLGIRDKRAELEIILQQTGFQIHQLGYIGDDVNDLEIIRRIGEHGLTAAPADAMPAVQQAVHYRCTQRGGYGAFRDFAEWILRLRNSGTP